MGSVTPVCFLFLAPRPRETGALPYVYKPTIHSQHSALWKAADPRKRSRKGKGSFAGKAHSLRMSTALRFRGDAWLRLSLESERATAVFWRWLKCVPWDFS